jgi:hypothetical protein
MGPQRELDAGDDKKKEDREADDELREPFLSPPASLNPKRPDP